MSQKTAIRLGDLVALTAETLDVLTNLPATLRCCGQLNVDPSPVPLHDPAYVTFHEGTDDEIAAIVDLLGEPELGSMGDSTTLVWRTGRVVVDMFVQPHRVARPRKTLVSSTKWDLDLSRILHPAGVDLEAVAG